MQILVTGGGGFLGTAICRALVERGDAVRSLSRGPHPALAALGVEHRRGDLADAEAVAAAIEGVDAVIHTAALAGVWGDERAYFAANLTGTVNVLTAMRRHGVGRLVYTSTPSVVQTDSGCEGGDASTPYALATRTAYQRSKIAAEQAVVAANGADLSTVALRPRLIFGPGDPHIAPRLAERSRAGRLARVGAGNPLVDATYVDNAASAHLAALDRLAPGAALCGRAYFVSNGEPWPLWDLIAELLDAVGAPPVRRQVPAGVAFAAGALCEVLWTALPLGGEPPMTRFLARQLSTANWYDISETCRDLGWQPGVNMKEGIARLRQASGGRAGG